MIIVYSVPDSGFAIRLSILNLLQLLCCMSYMLTLAMLNNTRVKTNETWYTDDGNRNIV